MSTDQSAIRHFRGRYAFLSNFASSLITLDGIEYPTAEHAFQAHKTLDSRERVRIAGLKAPASAKKAGRGVALRPDWEDVKVDVMREVLLKKFARGSTLAEELLGTGEVELIEGTDTWSDRFWGVANGVGENHLGRLLMEIRRGLREANA